jgi:putative transposase
MKQARVTDGALREHEASAKTADPARRFGVSEVTLTNRKAKYGDIELVNEGIRIRYFTDDIDHTTALLRNHRLPCYLRTAHSRTEYVAER